MMRLGSVASTVEYLEARPSVYRAALVLDAARRSLEHRYQFSATRPVDAGQAADLLRVLADSVYAHAGNSGVNMGNYILDYHSVENKGNIV